MGSEACSAVNRFISSPQRCHTIKELIPLTKQLVDFFQSTVHKCLEGIHHDLKTVMTNSQTLQADLSALGGTMGVVRGVASSDKDRYCSVLCVLLTACFRVTNITLTFCKEVELNHTHIFDSISKDIGPLFKNGFMLLKVSSECIEYASPAHIPDNDHTHISDVLSSLQSVSLLALTFDPSLVILAWKALGKLVCHLKDHTHLYGEGQWSLEGVIGGMCEALVTKSEECVTSASQNNEVGGSSYGKLLKTCRFFATMIVKVAKEYCDLFYVLAEGFFKFLLQLTRLLPPSLSCPTHLTASQCSEIDANITVVVEPLVMCLATSEHFLHLLTKDHSDSWSYSRLFLLCVIMKNYQKLTESLKRFLLEERSSRSQSGKMSCDRLFSAVFHCVKACHVEFSIPVHVMGVVIGGHAPCHVTLYEHVLTQVCSVVAILSAEDFNRLERYLIGSLIIEEGVYTSQLIMDVLCFIARWGNSALCYSHVVLLTKLLFTLPADTTGVSLRVKGLLRRTLAFTTPTQQRDLLRLYPPHHPPNLTLWACVPFLSLDQSIRGEACTIVCVTSCDSILSNAHPLICYNSLQCINAVLSEPNLKPHLPATKWPTVVEKVIKMLNGITSLGDIKETNTNPLYSLIAQEILWLLSHLITTLDHEKLMKVLNTLHVICTTSLPVGVSVGVARILAQCGELTNQDILTPLTSCFKSLLSHTHSWILHNQALEGFKQFAGHTPHVEVLEECIPAGLDSSIVVDYIQNVPVCSRSHPNLMTLSNIKLLLEYIVASSSDYPVAKDTDHTHSQNDHAHDWELDASIVADLENDSLIILEEEGGGLEGEGQWVEPEEGEGVQEFCNQWDRLKRRSLTATDKRKLLLISEEINLLCNYDFVT